MKSLFDFIFESKSITTNSNKQRKKELEKWLKHKDYEDYVDTLNKMLEDPKAKTLLEDGFGGELGDTKLDFTIKEIPASQLMPTQSDIYLDKSLNFSLKDEKVFDETFKNPIIIGRKPIVTFRENYIIDGHHAWIQAAILNPSGKLLAFNYDGEISPIQMLKAVQGTIAAVKAQDNENNGKLPYSRSGKVNIYDKDFTEKKIKKFIENNIKENLISKCVDTIEECYDYESTINFITERILDIKSNNYPFESAPKRKEMPQIFKGGTKNNKESAMPEKKGSAMNKLKDDKFMKSITK